MTPGQILQTFYKEADLSEDGGFAESRVKVKITKHIYLYIPNIDARRKALLKHDVHHLLTGYKIDFKGELEESAWEIGSGCTKYWFAWAINMQGVMLGIWCHLGGVFRAFVRGRHSTNLYNAGIDDERLKSIPFSEIQNIIKIPAKNEAVKTTFADFISFLWNLFVGGIYSIAVIIVYMPFLLVYNTVVFIKIKAAASAW